MRILQINLERGWRGGERQTLLTLEGLRRAGHDAWLLARRGGELARRALAQGIPLHLTDGTAGQAFYLLRAGRGFDLWHAQTAQAMSTAALLRPVLRVPLVFTRRTAFAVRAGDRQRLRRWKWAQADALVAISEAAARVPADLGLEVDVIPSAVPPFDPDPVQVDQLRQEFATAGRRVVVTAAALSPEKDPLTLIEAVSSVRQVFPDILCLHCGADGQAAAQVRARIQALGLQEHYRLVGFRPRVADFLALADVYVSSSRFEALGTSVLDACLAGVPVVATEVGGHREILAPDRGLLVPAGDPQALARRLGWALSHPEPAQAMARRAHDLVAREFAVDTMVARYEALYRRLVPAPAGQAVC